MLFSFISMCLWHPVLNLLHFALIAQSSHAVYVGWPNLVECWSWRHPATSVFLSIISCLPISHPHVCLHHLSWHPQARSSPSQTIPQGMDTFAIRKDPPNLETLGREPQISPNSPQSFLSAGRSHAWACPCVAINAFWQMLRHLKN